MCSTTDRVRRALSNNGYTIDFRRARFVNLNSFGQEIHEIEFEEEGRALVYVWDDNGVWKGDF